MNPPEPSGIRFHEDLDLFREAVNLTAAQTEFSTRLIEKDYFCTLLLAHLSAADSSLVFKGGTCLAKVHGDFYRLSEDLDFAIPMAVDASRDERRRRAATVKRAVAALSGFRIVEPLRGANESAQYLGIVAYTSLLSAQEETIRVEISLREPLLMPAETGEARTLLLDPITRGPKAKARAAGRRNGRMGATQAHGTGQRPGEFSSGTTGRTSQTSRTSA